MNMYKMLVPWGLERHMDETNVLILFIQRASKVTGLGVMGSTEVWMWCHKYVLKKIILLIIINLCVFVCVVNEKLLGSRLVIKFLIKDELFILLFFDNFLVGEGWI